MNAAAAELRVDLDAWRARAQALQDAIGGAVVGQAHVVRLLAVAVFARGHVLLEGDVGVGKTTLLRALARGIGGAYGRIEGTVDLMPADLLYHTYLDEDGRPRVAPGPLLAGGEDLSVFFFNEINRARPQVHAVLLRLMAEGEVEAFRRPWRFPHLQVFADRNRIEREETFELPAAARDRFFMEITVAAPADAGTRRGLIFDPRYHDVDALVGGVDEAVVDHRALGRVAAAIQRAVASSATLEQYVVGLWDALRHPQAAGIALEGVDMARLVRAGASPRGMAYLVRAARVQAWLEGRDHLLPEDLRAVFHETVAHRVFLDPVYEPRRDALVRALCAAVFDTVPVP